MGRRKEKLRIPHLKKKINLILKLDTRFNNMRALAQHCGISYNTMASWWAIGEGKKQPANEVPIDRLHEICERVNVNLSLMLEECFPSFEQVLIEEKSTHSREHPYQELVSSISSALMAKSGRDAFYLFGESGVGKTTLLRELSKSTLLSSTYNFCFIEAANINCEKDVWNEILDFTSYCTKKRFRNRENNKVAFILRVLKEVYSTNNQLLIVIDNLARSTDYLIVLIEKIVTKVPKSLPVKFILVGHNKIASNVFYSFKMENLDENKIKAYVSKNTKGQISPIELEVISKKICNIRPTLLVADLVCQHISSTSVDDACKVFNVENSDLSDIITEFFIRRVQLLAEKEPDLSAKHTDRKRIATISLLEWIDSEISEKLDCRELFEILINDGSLIKQIKINGAAFYRIHDHIIFALRKSGKSTHIPRIKIHEVAHNHSSEKIRKGQSSDPIVLMKLYHLAHLDENRYLQEFKVLAAAMSDDNNAVALRNLVNNTKAIPLSPNVRAWMTLREADSTRLIGRFREARESYIELTKLYKKHDTENYELICSALCNHGVCSVSISPENPQELYSVNIEAIQMLQKCLDLAKRKDDSFYFLLALVNIGLAHQNLSRVVKNDFDMLEEALACYKEATRICRRLLQRYKYLNSNDEVQFLSSDFINSSASRRFALLYAKAHQNLGSILIERSESLGLKHTKLAIDIYVLLNNKSQFYEAERTFLSIKKDRNSIEKHVSSAKAFYSETFDFKRLGDTLLFALNFSKVEKRENLIALLEVSEILGNLYFFSHAIEVVNRDFNKPLSKLREFANHLDEDGFVRSRLKKLV